MALLKVLRLLSFGISSIGYGYFQVYKYAHFVPGPTFIQGPMIIIFAKFSRLYVYSLSKVRLFRSVEYAHM